MVMSGSILLRMRNVADKSCRENQNIFCVVTFFFFENRAVCEMWGNTVERGRQQMTKLRMRIACWITNATDTHSEYVILIVFPL
jgi:hypothetical protein